MRAAIARMIMVRAVKTKDSAIQMAYIQETVRWGLNDDRVSMFIKRVRYVISVVTKMSNQIAPLMLLLREKTSRVIICPSSPTGRKRGHRGSILNLQQLNLTSLAHK